MRERRLLNSWKEIAKHMGRGVRTVQRYEQYLALPIHRPSGKERSAVLAFTDEIDEWLRNTPIRNGVPSNGRASVVVTKVFVFENDRERDLQRAKENVDQIFAAYQTALAHYDALCRASSQEPNKMSRAG